MNVLTTIDIDAPPPQVWDVLTDFDAYPQWNPIITRLERGRPEVGSRIRFRIKMGRLALPIDAEIVTATEPEELAWIGPAAAGMRRFVSGEHYFRVEPDGDGKSRFIHGEDFRGFLVPRRFRRGEKMLTRAYEALNRALKRRVENGG